MDSRLLGIGRGPGIFVRRVAKLFLFDLEEAPLQGVEFHRIIAPFSCPAEDQVSVSSRRSAQHEVLAAFLFNRPLDAADLRI